MRIRYRAWAAMGFLAWSSAALAQGDMCQGMGMMGQGDAKMTKAAFLKHAEERFTHMDANGDGTIDAGERKKMQEQMQTCMGRMEEMGMMCGEGDKSSGMAKPEDAHSAHHPTP